MNFSVRIGLISRKLVRVLPLLFLISQIFNISIVSHAFAAPTPTPAPAEISGGDWRFDPVVDEVGKSAARARQLIYWVFSHSPINRAEVLIHMWSISRTIVYVFFLLVLAAGALGFILAKHQGRIGPIFSGVSSPFFGFEIPSFILKIAVLMFYVTFSYVFVLGLMEFAQILTKFFIKNLGGCNLFNINFGRATECVFPDQPERYRQLMIEMEKNYTGFVGYRDFSAGNQEMVNTSLFFIRLTTLTYNVMSIMVLLRQIILWFLLIVSPFLALFMPFVFIRNIGWIWIGVFMQWLFYGPLFALFVAGLVNIWQAGIPYGFDFSRTPEHSKTACAKPPEGGHVYPTSINILWGGPAQTLSQCNSANYIDTYAEYVISLIMLWATILLPWLLLRIFRDYCCDILRQNQATLQAIYNRLRAAPISGSGLPQKPTKPGAIVKSDKALPLPFRRVRDEGRRERKKAREISIEKLRNISNIETRKLSRALDVSIESLRDIAQVETDSMRRSKVQERLDKLAHPTQIADAAERQEYVKLRGELLKRATRGDIVASRILESASRPRLQSIMQQIAASAPAAISKSQIKQVAQTARVSEDDVSKVAGMLPKISSFSRSKQIAEAASGTRLNEEEAGRVLDALPQILPTTITAGQVTQAAQKTGVSEDDVSKVVGMLPTISNLPRTSQVEEVEKQTGLSEEQAERLLTSLPQTRPKALIRRIPRALPVAVSANQIRQTAKATQVSEDDVSEIVRMLPSILQLTNEQQIKEVVKRTNLTEEQAEKVLLTLSKTSPVKRKTEEAVPTKVTIEDYEEVKTMWLNHYRKTVVPKSGKVKSRKDWLQQDVQKITNALNLFEARQEELKKEGVKEVEKILPFLLLGGFTDEETVMYMKAKLEAARQVLQEVGEIEKAKEKAKEEEEIIEVPMEKEEEKTMEARLAEAQELPIEEEKRERNVLNMEADKERKDTPKEQKKTSAKAGTE